jgi:hypothetical protein
MVRLVASNGFNVRAVLDMQQQEAETPIEPTDGVEQDSELEPQQATAPRESSQDYDTTDIDKYIELICKDIELQEMFERGVYLESGLGDCLYRISYDHEISDKPILECIEPQNFELHYRRGKITKVVIKDCDDINQMDAVPFKVSSAKGRHIVEMHETYTKRNGFVTVTYSFWRGDNKIEEHSGLYDPCKRYWGIDDMVIQLPFREFPVIFKKNAKQSILYKHERGVPDIHGLDTMEDALSESLSQLIDAIRKATIKTIVSEEMLPSDEQGNTQEYSDFDRVFITLKEAGADPSKLLTQIQGRIDYQAFIETARALISHAINKAGLSPTTLGVTGLESINSSVDSQDAREKPSLRTREIKLAGWKTTLQEILNKYLQYVDFINNRPVADYSELIDVTFNDYINPSVESVLQVLAQAVAGKVYSIETAVMKVFEQEGKNDYTLDDIIIETARIKGITPQQEMESLGLMPTVEPESEPQDNNQKPATDTPNNALKPATQDTDKEQQS